MGGRHSGLPTFCASRDIGSRCSLDIYIHIHCSIQDLIKRKLSNLTGSTFRRTLNKHLTMVAQPIGTKKTPVTSTAKKTPVTAPVKKSPVKAPAVQPPKKPVNTAMQKKPMTTTPKKPVTTVAPKKPVTAIGQKKPIPAPAKNAVQQPQQQGWINKGLSAASSGIGSAVSAATTGIGNAAGAVVTAAGSGVAGAGRGAGAR
jgi:outer membrane biosynthesis protein TonB